jgi:hypothetical protein
LAVYIAPSPKQGVDAIAVLWVRASEVAGDLDEVLYATVRRWLWRSLAIRVGCALPV